ncbi:MAG: hypothetical protein WC917_03030 [Bacilli bacterium]|jgi:hypothetical protein
MFKFGRLNYSTMGGKLKGFAGVNTSSLDNPFCTHMTKNPKSVCAKCYSIRMLESYRANCRPAFQKNAEILANDLLYEEEIKPCKKEKIALRFSAHGELYNLCHLYNCFQIAKVNSDKICTLFTKRIDLLKQTNKSEIPDNMIIVYSNPLIDNPLSEDYIKELELICHINKVFNVFTKKYSMDKGISINCSGKKCKDCMVCYSQNNINVINELVK